MITIVFARHSPLNIAAELEEAGVKIVGTSIDAIEVEANPMASRTVPIVSKVCGISMASIATQLML